MATDHSNPVGGHRLQAKAVETAYQRFITMRRFGSLDGLRCLCILAVLWHHGPWWTALDTSARILQRGFTGVDFFFVLSGFLITTLLLREIRVTGRFSLGGFYWRRALRILPVYFFVVTLVSAYYIGAKGQTEYLSVLPYYYLFLSNFLIEHIPMLAPTWSLGVEEQYYMIWPLLLLMLPRPALLPVLGGLIAVNVLGVMGSFGLTARELGPLRVGLPSATYAPILIGTMLALLLDRKAVFQCLWPLLGNRLGAPIAFLLIAVLLQILPDDLRGLPNLLLHLTMAAALAALVMREDNLLAPLMRWRPVARMGEISYGIYLYHLIALHITTIALGVTGLSFNPLILFLYSALSFLIADVSDRSLERYFRQFRDYGSTRKRLHADS